MSTARRFLEATSAAFRSAVRTLGSHPVRSVLLWCLPALIAGVVLRGVLMWQMPRAFYHPDSYTVFETYSALVREGDFHIQPKKTPLAPLLYAAVLAVRLPALVTIALLQHAIGLLVIPLVGGLVALSFRFWRWFIIPATLLVALDPVLLWYEHLTLPESLYTTGIVAMGLAGLLLFHRPGWGRLVLFLALLFFVTTGRPEGKLWCLFGVALVVRVAWPRWRWMGYAFVGMLAFTAFCFLVNRTAQSGSLLYSNVAHLTPDSLRCAPGFVEENRDYFADLRARWSILPRRIPFERKEVITRVRKYMKSRGMAGGGPTQAANVLSGKIANEVCLRNLTKLPALAVIKFREGLREPTTEGFGSDWVHRRQLDAYTREDSPEDRGIEDDTGSDIYTRLLLGKEFNSEAELEAHLRELYRPFEPDWLTQYTVAFQDGLHWWRLRDLPVPGSSTVPGFPVLFILSAAGLLALAIRERGLNYHYLWLGALLFMAFVLALTGSNKGRFRIVFEPLWFLYALALLDVAFSLCEGVFRRTTAGKLPRESQPQPVASTMVG